MTSNRPMAPEMRPACRDDFPSEGDTVWTVCWSSLTGRAPKFSSVARALACDSLNWPEIWTVPANEVNVPWDGWVIGAEMTRPSRSMPMMAWNCCWANASHAVAPAPLNVMLTVHCPAESTWALADLICDPVTPAGQWTVNI